MPTRTCVVCRKKDEKGGLLRFVLVSTKDAVEPILWSSAAEEGTIRLGLDLRHMAPGRGVYCHCKARCFTEPGLLAMALAAFARADHGASRLSSRRASVDWNPNEGLIRAIQSLEPASEGERLRLSRKEKAILAELKALQAELMRGAVAVGVRRVRIRM